jgi:hypothetical protein
LHPCPIALHKPIWTADKLAEDESARRIDGIRAEARSSRDQTTPDGGIELDAAAAEAQPVGRVFVPSAGQAGGPAIRGMVNGSTSGRDV